MLAVGRAEVATLNEAARATLRRSGRLGADVLEVDGLGFAVGDKVVCLRNDRRIGVVNGTVGTVERAVGQGLAIGTAEGPRLLPKAYLEAGHLGHAYALTIHKAQGLTVERAYVLAGESLTQEAGYVAMSRARETTELFVPLAAVADDARARPAPPRGARPARRGAAATGQLAGQAARHRRARRGAARRRGHRAACREPAGCGRARPR